jgi:ribosomal protein S27AE
MAERFKIQITGIKTDADSNKVIGKLSALFKSSPDRIRTILKNQPAVIKTDLPRAQAEKYRTALEKAGVHVEVVPIETAQSAPGKILKTCPNCGYEATNPADTLITAHDGRGECPRCGIVPKKFRPTGPEQDSGHGTPPQDDNGVIITDSRPKSFPLPTTPTGWGVVVLAVVAIVLVSRTYFGGGSGDTPADSALKLSEFPGEPVPGAVGGQEEQNECLIIPPDESRTYTLTGPIGLLVEPGTYSRWDGHYEVAENTWQEGGVFSRVLSSRAYTETHDIWTGEMEWPDLQTGTIQSVWQPISSRGYLVQGFDLRFQTDERNVFFLVDYPEALRLQGNLSLSEARKEWQGAPDKKEVRIERRPFVFTYVVITFSVTAPSEEAIGALDHPSGLNSGKVSFGHADLSVNSDRNISKTKQSIFVRISSVRKFVNRRHDGYQGIAVRSPPAGFSLTCE